MAGGDPGPIIMAANAVASKVKPKTFGEDFAYVLHKLTDNPVLTKKVWKFIEKGGNNNCHKYVSFALNFFLRFEWLTISCMHDNFHKD